MLKHKARKSEWVLSKREFPQMKVNQEHDFVRRSYVFVGYVCFLFPDIGTSCWQFSHIALCAAICTDFCLHQLFLVSDRKINYHQMVGRAEWRNKAIVPPTSVCKKNFECSFNDFICILITYTVYISWPVKPQWLVTYHQIPMDCGQLDLPCFSC